MVRWRKIASVTALRSNFSPLHIAAAQGTPKDIQEYLLLGVPIDNRDGFGMTPLHLCASRGTLQNIKVLVAAGANLEAVDLHGETALHHAVTNKNTSEIIRYLIEQGIAANSPDRGGNTPLHICAQAGNLNNLKVILDLDPDLSGKNRFGQNALHHAAMNQENVGVLAYLLNKGMSMDTFDDLGQAVIHRCASHGNKINMQVLLQKGCDIEMKNIDGLTPLCCAICNPNAREMIEYLLSQGAAIDSRDNFGDSPLHLYATRGSLETVKLLVKNGADILARNELGGTVLHDAVWNERGVIEFLLDQGIPLEARSDDGATALLDCAAQGTLANLRILLQRGANLHAQDESGRTAIHHAAMNANAADIVEYLLKKGLSIDALDNHGMTPLHYASKIRKGVKSPRSALAHVDVAETLKYFLKKGASINVRDKKGRTPLLICASSGNLLKMKLLVKKGADIGDRTKSNLSSLHLAAVNKKTIHIMQYLLYKGISPEVKDELGRTPLLFCAANGNLKNVKFLCDKGADLKSLDDDKMTALHHAAANKEGGPIIEYLLARGIPVDVKNDMGLSPFLVAKGCGIAENERILFGEIKAQAAKNSTDQL